MKNRTWKVLGDYVAEKGVQRAVIDQALEEQYQRHKPQPFGQHRPFGEHVPLGQVLVDNNILTQEEVQELMKELEKDRLEHLDPVSQFSPSTKFGERLREHVCDKKEVARITAERFVQPAGRVFIADGTSGFYTFLAIARGVAPKGTVEVRTNSLAIPFEFSQSAAVAAHTDVRIVGDAPDKPNGRNDFLAIIGKHDRTRDAIKRACEDCAAVLPVTGLSYEEGPFARDDHICEIKKLVMESAARAVFVADFSKMSKTLAQMKANGQRPVYIDKRDWVSWRDSRLWNLVTSIHPKVQVVVGTGKGEPDSATALRKPDPGSQGAQRYHQQATAFRVDREHVTDGFIEIRSFYDG